MTKKLFYHLNNMLMSTFWKQKMVLLCLHLKNPKLVFPLVLRIGGALANEDVVRDPNWDKLLNFDNFT